LRGSSTCAWAGGLRHVEGCFHGLLGPLAVADLFVGSLAGGV